MVGLAIGGYFIGKYADRMRKLLLVYGLLELGIAFLLALHGADEGLSAIYIYLAQGKDDSPAYLFVIRMLFSLVASSFPRRSWGTLPSLPSSRPANPRT